MQRGDDKVYREQQVTRQIVEMSKYYLSQIREAVQENNNVLGPTHRRGLEIPKSKLKTHFSVTFSHHKLMRLEWSNMPYEHQRY